MGADGHVLLVRAGDVPDEYADLMADVEALTGWECKTLFGSEPFLWAYWDTHGVEAGWTGLGSYYWEIEDYRRSIERSTVGAARQGFQDHIDRIVGSITARGYTVEQAQRAAEFSEWLQFNATDWQVWT